ncbi:MAG: PA domain-containing protein [Actinomycetota bacterium]
MSKRVIAAFAAAGLVASMGVASAGPKRWTYDPVDGREMGAQTFQHDEGHLPASRENMRKLGDLDLSRGVNSSITDVDAHKGYAYVGTDYAECEERGGAGRLGVHVVDVRNPRAPKKVAFIETNARNGEGIHAFSVNTPRFKGDLLLLSNESCDGFGEGGISVVDVTNPTRPRMLAQNVGDTDANDPEDPTPLEAPNDVHSVMGWSDGAKAYAIMTDNFEAGFLDVDVMDLTNPRRPRLVSETGYSEWTDAISPQLGFGDNPNQHDLWVKKIGGEWRAMISYWDAGWVLLDVDDPTNPTVLDDSDYATNDPEFPQFSPPEGNAHQGSWSSNNRFFVGTGEDFGAFRIDPFEITSGANAGQEFAASEFGWTVPISEEYAGEDQINGPTVYVGTACPAVEDDPATPEDESDPGTAKDIPDASTLDVAEGEERIAVALRGTCFFSLKVDEVQQKGYDAVIIANHHAGSGAGENPDAQLCGSQGHAFDPTINAVCVGHRAFHLIFEQTPTYEGADEPAIGTEGADVRAVAAFDGWGYAHLLNASTLEEIDTYTVDEAKERALVSAGGPVLSVHEVETDKRRGVNLAYFSWYGAGARVARFGSGGFRETGHFIDRGGNDFWGVETIKRGKRRPLLLFSDRDFGLYILKYTGPQ